MDLVSYRLARGSASAAGAHSAADSRVSATGRRARRADAPGPGVAAASGMGRLAGQHAESRAALAPRSRRRRRAVDLGGPVARPALGTSVQHLRRCEARLRAVLAREAP